MTDQPLDPQPATIVDEIAAIHAQHSIMVGTFTTRCMCGLKLRGKPSYRSEHARHVAEVINDQLGLQRALDEGDWA